MAARNEGAAGRREERSDERRAAASGSRRLPPDPEVRAKATRRRFTAEYKLSVVEEAEACENRGEVGALLRREGLYSSHLSSWRKAAQEGSLQALAKKRGPKPKPASAKRESNRVRQLEREIARLREELRKARIIIDVQGKVAGLLGVSLGDGRSS